MKKILLLAFLFLSYPGDTFAEEKQDNQVPQTQGTKSEEVDWNFVVATLKKAGYSPVKIKIAIDSMKAAEVLRKRHHAR